MRETRPDACTVEDARGAVLTRLKAVASNACGYPVGDSHPNARHSDEVVEKARAMLANGRSLSAVSALLGVPVRTLRDWDSGRRRAVKAVRVIMRRVSD